MIRSIAALVTSFGLAACGASALAANAPGSPEPMRTPDKIIEDIRLDLEKASSHLSNDDPGAQTRAAQDRVLKNIDDLLNQKAPNPPPSTSSPPPLSPPKSPLPAPKPAAPSVQTAPKPAPVSSPPQPAGVKANDQAAPPKELAKDSPYGPWWDTRTRARVEVDAHARERFVPAYEEAIRAYYRNIAENTRPKRE